MSWDTSSRRSELPADWPAIRAAALNRDHYRCRHTDGRRRRCEQRATDVDHIRDRDDHSLTNLQSLCKKHHRDKTIAEAHNAMRAIRAHGKHNSEAHPFERRR